MFLYGIIINLVFLSLMDVLQNDDFTFQKYFNLGIKQTVLTLEFVDYNYLTK